MMTRKLSIGATFERPLFGALQTLRAGKLFLHGRGEVGRQGITVGLQHAHW
jgi:hypothetical protein